MGRTLNTYRNILEIEKSRFLRHTRHTNREIRILSEKIFSRAQFYADSATFFHSGLITEKIVLTMLFSQYKDILTIENQ